MVSSMTFWSCTEPVTIGITGSAASSPFLAGHAKRPAAFAPRFLSRFGFHFMFSNCSQWPNQSPEPTAVIAFSFSIRFLVCQVTGRRWLSFFR